MGNQIIQDVFEKLSDQVKDTATDAAQEPLKMVQNILGEETSEHVESQGDSGIEDLSDDGSAIQNAAQAQLIQQKKAQAERKRQELLNLHRQRLDEERQFYESRERQEDQEERIEQQEEEEKEQQKIFQLKRRQEEILQSQTQAKGSGEMIKKKDF